MKRIAIAGNPNCGKTCIFNNLTGSIQRVGNYPGVTVEFVSGEATFGTEKVDVVDLPGTYSLTAYSQEEVVARNYIVEEKPDVIVNVVDASNLERNLYLTSQLIELKVPIVIALNMCDVAEKKGVSIDAAKLSKLLGVKVVKTIAPKKSGFAELKEACLETIEKQIIPRPFTYSHELDQVLPNLIQAVKENKELCGEFPPSWVAVKLLEDDDIILKKLDGIARPDKIKKELARAKEHLQAHSNEESATSVVEARYGFASGATMDVSAMSEHAKQMLTDVIDRVVCNRFFGPIILCLVVYALFQFVFKCAEVEWIFIGKGWISPTGLFEKFFEMLSMLVERYVETPWLLSLLNDGIISGVGGVMSFVPLIFFMFLFIAVLEDTGYVARVAFIMDRVLKTFGLQGKSILALIVSGGLGAGGCAVPGVMATRTLREEKDRLITILVAPFMNCGAKMPVYAMLIAAFFAEARGAMMFLLWLLSWGFALVAAVCLRKWIIKGEQTPFVMELPVYHVPTFKGILMDTWYRTYLYIKKAATIILAINVVMWVMMYFPRTSDQGSQEKLAQAKAELIEQAGQTRYKDIFTQAEFDKTLAAIKSSQERDTASKTDNKALDEFCYQLKTYQKAGADSEVAAATPKTAKFITAYQTYKEQVETIENEQQQTQLLNSVAGRIGKALVPISTLAGFDWRDNIALIGGFAAKEVVLGTLATAYAMGNVDPEESESLAQQLKNDPKWNRLRGFVLMVFVMGYAPCFATIAAIKKETNKWKWAIFSTVYSTAMAFVVAAVIYQIGSLFIK